MTETVKVKGMMCQMCEKHVSQGLKGIDGVTSATADHEKGEAVIEATKPIDEADIKKAIEDAGYEFVSVEA